MTIMLRSLVLEEKLRWVCSCCSVAGVEIKTELLLWSNSSHEKKKTVSLSFLFWQLHNEAIFKKLLGEDEECVGCCCEEEKKNLVLQKSLEKPHLIKTLSFATTTKKTTTPCDKKHFSSCSATSYSSTATYKLQTQGNLQGGWCIQYTRNVCVCVCKMTPDLISWENKVVKLTLF